MCCPVMGWAGRRCNPGCRRPQRPWLSTRSALLMWPSSARSWPAFPRTWMLSSGRRWRPSWPARPASWTPVSWRCWASGCWPTSTKTAHPKDQPEMRRHLRFHDRDGGYELSGWLYREAAEIVRSALSPLAAPRPTTDVEVDLRTAAQRDADALVELAQRALGSGELPTE